jgi:hypothetical protein
MKIPDSLPIVMLHVDAHADLSIPSATGYKSMKEWADIDLLYDLLSEEGGIAEFIIPLITQKFLSQVIWVKPEWSEQFPIDSQSFQIEDVSQSSSFCYPKVNCNLPYYVEDDSYQPFTKSSESTDIHVLTCSVDSSLQYDSPTQLFLLQHNAVAVQEYSPSSEGQEVAWVLDICLDYFSTNNPFFEPFLLLYKDSSSQPFSPEEFLEIVKFLFYHMPYRKRGIKDPHLIKSEIDKLLKECLSSNDGENKKAEKQIYEQFSGIPDATNYLEKFFRQIPSTTNQFKEFILAKGHLLLLPHHTVGSFPELQIKIDQLEQFLRTFMSLFPSSKKAQFPLFITMATSESDNYILPDQLNFVRTHVLQMLDSLFDEKTEIGREAAEDTSLKKRTFTEHQEYRSILVHDIREEPIEMAYNINFRQHSKKTQI